MDEPNNETDSKEISSEASKTKNTFSENNCHKHDNCLSSRENTIRIKNDDKFNTILSQSTLNKTSNNENLSLSEIRLRQIQEEINSKKLLISSLDSQLNKLHRYRNSDFIKKKKQLLSLNDNEKIISKLKSKNTILISNLSNLSNKLRTLEENAYLDTIQVNNRKSKLKSIKTERETIQNKINEIDNQINIILAEEKNKTKKPRRKLINDYDIQIKHNIFIDSTPKKKALKRIYPTYGDNDNIFNSIRNLEFQYLKEEEKKEFSEKQLKYKELRDRELEVVHLRRMKIGNRELEIQNYGNGKYVPKKDYISSEEKELKRKIEEETLQQIENKKRRLRVPPICSAELNKFSNEVKKNEKILKEELKYKKKQMLKLWTERKKLIPAFRSKFLHLDNQSEEENNLIKKERKQKNFNDKLEYAEEIIKNFKPKSFSRNLKTAREKKIQELEGVNRYNDIKNLGQKLKRISEKIINSQPKNFKLNKNTIELQESSTSTKKIPLEKPINYLNEIRKKMIKKHLITPEGNMMYNINKWNEILNNENENLYKGIEKVKRDASILQNKADNKIQLLKINNFNSMDKIKGEDIIKKDKLNNEISNLYINSIEAKLQILKKLNE